MNEPRQIGPYPIERELGRGGMGIVYLGRDTRLGRPVAIKVLPAHFSSDPERLARFEREAKLLASLNHPNIAGIYGLEEAEGERFLALEYVEGPTLAERLARGPLPLDEALEIGRQIAMALEAAHDGGIIHRDLKPGNVKVTPSGDVKVLDFGLAKGSGTADSNPDLSQSPTLAHAPTGAGVILGTAAYMSPEQARGRGLDRRTDIWSFGCVMYEVFTGRQLFGGETVSDIIARILERTPDWKALPESLPERVRELLRRCLEKDARKRLRDIGDARLELEEALAARSSRGREAAADAEAARNAPRASTPWLAWAIAAVAVLVAGVAVVGPMLRRAPERAIRLTVQGPAGATISADATDCAISPDGTAIVMTASDSTGRSSLWVRSLDRQESRSIPGTENASFPFWSPDSRSIAFFADGKLKRVRLDGESGATVICPAPSTRGGDWSRDGTILFAPSGQSPIFAVRATGGEPHAVTTLDTTRHESAHRFPHFLPDGRHFLYVTLPGRERGFDVRVGSLDGRSSAPVLQAEGSPIYVEPGWLLYRRNLDFVAQRFDPRSLTLKGDPIALPDAPGHSYTIGYSGASASEDGVLAYTNPVARNARLTWLDRSGKIVGLVPVPPAEYSFPAISHDGHRIAVTRSTGPTESDIWIIDMDRGVSTRFTYGPRKCQWGIWSPNDDRLVFESNRKGPYDLYVKPASGATPEVPLLQGASLFKHLGSWTPDGKDLVVSQLSTATSFDLWIVPADGSGPPRPFLQTPFTEQGGEVSPDGRWIVYTSDESGRVEAYVQSFPVPGHKYQLTTEGCFYARFSPNGREIFVLSTDLQSVSAAEVLESGTTFRASTPRLLFRLPGPTSGLEVTNDGRRFLATLPVGRAADPSITVTLNWKADLRARK